MNIFITHLKAIFSLAPTRSSRSFTYSNKMLAASRCALVMLGLLACAGVIQAQQKGDPLSITKEGNVGIGTTAPKNKLSVEGDADVSGKVGIGTATPANKLSVTGNADVSGNVGIGTATPANKLSVVGNSDFSGNVGIGTATPGDKLHVNGAIRLDDASLKFFGGGNVKGFVGPGRNNDFSLVAKENAKWLRLGATNGGIALWANGNAETGDTPQFLLKADGNVGIGTTTPANRLSVIGNSNFDGNVGIGTGNPTKAKLEISGAVGTRIDSFGFLNRAGNTGAIGASTINYSVWASNSIAAIEFHAFSDARIKNIQGRSDGATDLRTLLGIEVTDYRYKDAIANGNDTYKKVTGQQVEKVFPQAVSKHTEVVPDIYRQASIQDGWVTLATDLKKGERVKLITAKGDEGIYEVLEVAQGRFRTDFKPIGERVFVYGREVNDFLTVDYGAISMLNVSATQQIKKEKDQEVKALQEENAALRSQLAEQEKRLAAIEALLLSGDKPAARAASLQKAN